MKTIKFVHISQILTALFSILLILLFSSTPSIAFAQTENEDSSSSSEYAEDAEDEQCANYIYTKDTRQADCTKDDWVDRLIASGIDVNCRIYLEIPSDAQDGERYLMQGDEEFEFRKDKKIIISPIFLAKTPAEFEKLLESGANVNSVDSNGQTVLFYINDPEILEILTRHQIDINHKDNAGQTALSMLIPEMLKNTFSWTEDGILAGDDFDDDVGSGYVKDFTSHYHYAQALLKAGADVKGGESKSKALLAMNPEKFIKEIIKSGLTINAKDVDGYTPLHKLVIHKVADMRPRIGGSKHRFVDTELYDPIHVLLKAGANPNIKDDDGRTPLFYAENPNVVNDLIKSKANVNIQDKHGRTPLHYAVLYNRSALVPILKANPKINIKDLDGKKAADLADDEDVVYQIKHGGKLPYNSDSYDSIPPNKPYKPRNNRNADLNKFMIL